MKKIELLAPAGDMTRLKAALAGGADAVYLAGKAFGARKHAGNFTREELEEAVRYAHLRGRQVHVTVNTLYYEEELDKVLDYLEGLDRIGVDAVIVQDLGLVAPIKRRFPALELHASTQMSLHSTWGARWAARQGIDRVVAARENTLEEVADMARHISVEVFIHGAHCVAYSGQCLMSSLIGGRSGNRGACAQPCRKSYRLIGMHGETLPTPAGSHWLSPKDLRVADRLSEVVATGVDSLKIEGRMKSPQYAYAAAHLYRCLLDGETPRFDPDGVFNRETTLGRLFGVSDADYIQRRSPENHGQVIGHVKAHHDRILTLESDRTLKPGDEVKVFRPDGSIGGRIEKHLGADRYRLQSQYRFEAGERVRLSYDQAMMDAIDAGIHKPQGGIPLRMAFSAMLDGGLTLSLESEGVTVTAALPDRVQPAQKRPVTEADIRQQMEKLGETVYQLDRLEVTLGDNLFIRVADLNALRREGTRRLDEERLDRLAHLQPLDWTDETEEAAAGHALPSLAVEVTRLDQLDAARTCGIEHLYYDGIETLDEALKRAPDLIPVLPDILTDREYRAVEAVLDRHPEVETLMVRTLGQVEAFRDRFRIETDFTFNVTNHLSLAQLALDGVERVTLSEELSGDQIAAMLERAAPPTALTVYGHQRAMVSAYCPFRADKACGSCSLEGAFLEDEKGFRFPLKRAYGCRMKVLNSRPLDLARQMAQIITLGLDQVRLRMTLESPEEVQRTIGRFEAAIAGQPTAETNSGPSTTGHFIRGVKE